MYLSSSFHLCGTQVRFLTPGAIAKIRSCSAGDSTRRRLDSTTDVSVSTAETYCASRGWTIERLKNMGGASTSPHLILIGRAALLPLLAAVVIVMCLAFHSEPDAERLSPSLEAKKLALSRLSASFATAKFNGNSHSEKTQALGMWDYTRYPDTLTSDPDTIALTTFLWAILKIRTVQRLAAEPE